jgi:glycine cleavage system transcriptional repressor
VNTLAITAIGRDRPGIVAGVTRVLAALGANIEDSTMTRLRGTFAMTLVVAVDAEGAEVEDALAEVAGSLGLRISVVPAVEELEAGNGAHYVLTLHGADRPGIVAEVTALLAQVGGNVTEMTTRLTGDLYVLVCEVDLPPQRDSAIVAREVAEMGERLGVHAALRAAEADVL